MPPNLRNDFSRSRVVSEENFNVRFSYTSTLSEAFIAFFETVPIDMGRVKIDFFLVLCLGGSVLDMISYCLKLVQANHKETESKSMDFVLESFILALNRY